MDTNGAGSRQKEQAMKVIVGSGFVAQYPQAGGVLSVVLQYLLGLRRLGCQACWLELLWPEGGDDHARIRTLFAQLAAFGLERDCCLIYFPHSQWPEDSPDREWYGMTEAQFRRYCAEADLLLDLCASVRPRDLLASARRTAFLDLDPGFMQLWMPLGTMELPHDVFFTVGHNIGRPDCPVPTGGIDWHPFWPPVDLEVWQTAATEAAGPFSTVSQWWGYLPTSYNGEVYDGSKRTEFLRFLDLPAVTGQPFELALNLAPVGDDEDQQLLTAKGWRVVDAHQVAGDFAMYRGYIQRSRAEFSVAKPGYVKTQCGWLSDRSVCYLAAGRPVLVQDTGVGAILPIGRGLLSFTTLDQAVAGIEELRRHYRQHSQAARELAQEYFAADKVLERLLRDAGL
jgi:hypothetical protein